MAAIVQFYREWFIENADRRTDNIPLVSSPFPSLAISILYLLFVNKWGPKFMENRKPYRLENIMMVYNVFQVVINFSIALLGVIYLVPYYSFYCTPVDYSNGPVALLALQLVYVYYLIKISDLLDTVFFVLRKKSNQISFLHVYHHAGMVITAWFGVRYVGGGHSMFIGLFNCIVHTFMYFYYLLSTWNSKYKKSVWWKKYITQLQLVQFISMLAVFVPAAFSSDCGYPKSVIYFYVPQNFLMVYLFSKFYYNAYIKGSSAKPRSKATKGS